MKVLRITALMMIVLMATAGLAEARGRNGKGHRQGQGKGQCQTSLTSLPIEDLSDFEKNSLLQMREEEKLARDVYLTLGQQYDLPVFTNIPQSEQRHMDQLGQLLERYGLEDPITSGERGQFSSKQMQKLYDQLVAQGSQNEVAALKVGATIEDLDIFDLEKALAEGVDNQDIAMVYANLAKGSRNHMRAFTSQLEARGESYEAQYIAQADLETIASSDWERGNGKGKGNGKGMGNGKGNGQGRRQGGTCAQN